MFEYTIRLAGKAQQREREAAGHTAPVRKQGTVNVRIQFSFIQANTPAHNMAQHTFSVGLPLLLNLSENTLLDISRDVFS